MGDVGSWIWDIRNDRLVADRNVARLFGVPFEQAPHLPVAGYFSAIHSDDIKAVREQIDHAIETRSPYRMTYRIADGHAGYRWVNARGRVEYDENGAALLMAGVLLDITEQRNTEEKLRVAEERYRTLLTSMDEAFGIVQVLLDEQGVPIDYRFEEVNAAMEKQSGLVNAAGRTIREMVPDIEPHWISIYGRVALTREPARITEHSAAMGYWWDVFATPLGQPDEHRIAILFTDVTARLRAEESLRTTAADLSEANRRKTEFLATLAHELRNPLAPMRTALDLMRIAGADHLAHGKLLEMMDRQMHQMVHLIDDLMDVSRIDSGKIVLKMERIDLKRAIDHAVESAMPAIESAGHHLDINLPPDAVCINADSTRLAQIFGNLLTNAKKYTPRGGNISVTCSIIDQSVTISVSDTGIGIPEEEQHGVFELFSQTASNTTHAQGGLGIGLSLVRSLVTMHRGAISVSSAGRGTGTTFTLVFPVAAENRSAGQSIATAHGSESADVTGLRIVLADDNADAAIALENVLGVLGHDTLSVHDGLQAVERIADTKPDLAILDIGMPGLNGYEVARKIRTMPGLHSVALVALTGWGGELDRERSEEAGFDAHLTKPVGLAELDRVMRAAKVRRMAAP